MNKFKHKVGNTLIVIPTKMYPLSSKSKINVFHDKYQSGELDLPQELIDYINKEHFEMGFCYKNATKVVNKCHQIGMEAEFFSGWIFVGSNYPVHHAWAVVEDRVIDVSTSTLELDVIMKASKEFEDLSEEEQEKYDEAREYMAEKILEVKEKDISKYESTVIGKIAPYLCYVGSPDEPYNARKIYNDLMDKFPHHPSYKNLSIGKSNLQNILRNKGYS